MATFEVIWPIIIVLLAIPVILQWILTFSKDKIANINRTDMQSERRFTTLRAWIYRLRYIFTQIIIGIMFYSLPTSTLLTSIAVHNYYILNAVFHIIQVFGVIVYISTSFMNPGFIMTPHEKNETKSTPLMPLIRRDYRYRFEPINITIYNDDDLPPSYCERCRWIRPQRAKHDFHNIDRCIARFDHYDKYIGNAIGANNYRYFVLLLCINSIIYTTAFSLIFSIFVDCLNSGYQDIFGWIIIILLLLYIFTEMLFVIPLCAFYIFLTSINQTLYEMFHPQSNQQFVEFMKLIDNTRQYVSDEIDTENCNDFDQGFMQNWRLCWSGYRTEAQYFYGLQCNA